MPLTKPLWRKLFHVSSPLNLLLRTGVVHSSTPHFVAQSSNPHLDAWGQKFKINSQIPKVTSDFNAITNSDHLH